MYSPDLVEVVTGTARRLSSPVSLSQTLEAVAEVARDSVPGVAQAGVCVLGRRSRLEPAAATDPVVLMLDRRQCATRQGPVVEATKLGALVTAPDIAAEERWPSFAREALSAGFQACVAVPLRTDEHHIGAIGLYADSRGLAPETSEVARAVASVAATVIQRARLVHELTESLATRTMIGQAIGILMYRYGLTEERAVDYLKRMSNVANRKLRDVAAEVVAEAEARACDIVSTDTQALSY